MMMIGRLSEETIHKVLASVEAMLREPDVHVEMSRGVRWRDNYATGFREAEPTNGRTVTIRTGGGAVDLEETFEERMTRLLGES